MSKLAKYDAMVRAIALAYKVDEVKAIRDQAAALEHYARLAKDTENERRCCEIRLRAERKAGQILAKTQKAKGSAGKGRPKKGAAPKVAPKAKRARTIKGTDISHKQSESWQKLAAVPEEQFEAALEQADMPTTAGIIKATTEPARNPVSEDALWLWGRLKDFERTGLLAQEPADVISTMTDAMKNDVHTLAPRVSAWLKRIGATNG